MELTGKTYLLLEALAGLAKQLRWLLRKRRQYCFKRSE